MSLLFSFPVHSSRKKPSCCVPGVTVISMRATSRPVLVKAWTVIFFSFNDLSPAPEPMSFQRNPYFFPVPGLIITATMDRSARQSPRCVFPAYGTCPCKKGVPGRQFRRRSSLLLLSPAPQRHIVVPVGNSLQPC